MSISVLPWTELTVDAVVYTLVDSCECIVQVGPDLHPLVVLPVLVLLVGQLLDPPLALAQVLLRIPHPPILRIQLRLQLPDAGVHLGPRLPAPPQAVLLCLVQPGLQVLHLGGGGARTE